MDVDVNGQAPPSGDGGPRREETATEAEDALVSRLRSPDWGRRRAACEALGIRARACSTVDAVAARLDDDSPYVLAAACRALSRLGAVGLRDRFALVLAHPDEGCRVAAVEALDTCGGAETFDVLFPLLRVDTSEMVRRRAAFALQRHSTSTTWSALFTRWQSDALPRHRVWACDLAARFGDTTCVSTLLLLENDRDGHVRRAARLALLSVRARTGDEPTVWHARCC